MEKDASGWDAERAEHEAQASDLAAQSGALLLDYLRVTLPDDAATRARLKDWLGPQTRREVGWRGWYTASAHVLDGGIVAWCSDAGRAAIEGLLVDLPGKACACLGAQLVPFLEWALSIGKVSRADFAIDDRAGRVTLARIQDCDMAGGIVSRFKNRPSFRLEGWNGADGWTVYFGSRSGNALVRIYDKALQQGQPGPWVRVELESKAVFADALARAYFAGGSEVVVGQICRRLRFAEPCEDTNRRRWETCLWWAELLDGIEPGPSLLPGEKQTATVAALREYAERQAGPALATVLRADAGDLLWLHDMVSRSKVRLKPKHFAALALLELPRLDGRNDRMPDPAPPRHDGSEERQGRLLPLPEAQHGRLAPVAYGAGSL